MYCSKCGSKLKEGVKFCGKCGSSTIRNEIKETPIIKEVVDQEVKLESKSSNIIVLLVVLVTMIVSIGLIIGLNLI